ncbi:hypothetical protein A5867_001855, partial [Enterococcus sp. 6D12_DIV0197]
SQVVSIMIKQPAQFACSKLK